jgi:two-component system sensor histidine kinase BaeS
VLANLLTNSLRYTQSPGRVRVDWHTQGPLLMLTVDDTAPGVSASDMPQLFEPLFRADRSRQRSTSNGGADQVHSSGLGLSIVRTMVQAHGGSVEATASDLGGLRVIVRVPLRASGLQRDST